jgi:hypothetical protein
MTDDDECEAVRGMRIGRGNGSTRRKPAPASLRPPQIPHDLTWDRTRAAAMGSRLIYLTAIYLTIYFGSVIISFFFFLCKIKWFG